MCWYYRQMPSDCSVELTIQGVSIIIRRTVHTSSSYRLPLISSVFRAQLHRPASLQTSETRPLFCKCLYLLFNNGRVRSTRPAPASPSHPSYSCHHASLSASHTPLKPSNGPIPNPPAPALSLGHFVHVGGEHPHSF